MLGWYWCQNLVDEGFVIKSRVGGIEINWWTIIIRGFERRCKSWVGSFLLIGSVNGGVRFKIDVGGWYFSKDLLEEIETRNKPGLCATEYFVVRKYAKCFCVESGGGVSSGNHLGVKHIHNDIDDCEGKQRTNEESKGKLATETNSVRKFSYFIHIILSNYTHHCRCQFGFIP